MGEIREGVGFSNVRLGFFNEVGGMRMWGLGFGSLGMGNLGLRFDVEIRV